MTENGRIELIKVTDFYCTIGIASFAVQLQLQSTVQRLFCGKNVIFRNKYCDVICIYQSTGYKSNK